MAACKVYPDKLTAVILQHCRLQFCKNPRDILVVPVRWPWRASHVVCAGEDHPPVCRPSNVAADPPAAEGAAGECKCAHWQQSQKREVRPLGREDQQGLLLILQHYRGRLYDPHLHRVELLDVAVQFLVEIQTHFVYLKLFEQSLSTYKYITKIKRWIKKIKKPS